ncbi:hypothetical protein BJX96DRAFT_144175, partial [Aspergillus floccosus]
MVRKALLLTSRVPSNWRQVRDRHSRSKRWRSIDISVVSSGGSRDRSSGLFLSRMTRASAASAHDVSRWLSIVSAITCVFRMKQSPKPSF